MKRNQRAPVDRKSWFTYAILNWINRISVRRHFLQMQVIGREKLPASSYILIANHSARWDGPVVGQVIARANYMVSPNELKGLQGLLLRAGGAFPADPRLDLLSFMRKQAAKSEPIVIFPEGDIYRDGATHQFKKGAARTALLCRDNGLDVPIVPIAIRYSKTTPEVVQILVGDPISVGDYLPAYTRNQTQAIHNLTLALHREVCHLRAELGSKADRAAVLDSKPVRCWAPQILMQAQDVPQAQTLMPDQDIRQAQTRTQAQDVSQGIETELAQRKDLLTVR